MVSVVKHNCSLTYRHVQFSTFYGLMCGLVFRFFSSKNKKLQFFTYDINNFACGTQNSNLGNFFFLVCCRVNVTTTEHTTHIHNRQLHLLCTSNYWICISVETIAFEAHVWYRRKCHGSMWQTQSISICISIQCVNRLTERKCLKRP